MKDSVFAYTQDQLKQLAEKTLHYAKAKGASNAAVGISEGSGLTVNVRRGKIETIERNQDKGMGVTVYIGKKRGNATTSDFTSETLRLAVDAAYNIANYTTKDDAAGLPDEDMIEHHPKDLDLYYHWGINAEDAVEIAKRCEASAFAFDRKIKNSDGATVQVQHAHFVSADSQGFVGGYPYSSHMISIAPIAGKNANMQRDYWYSSERNPGRLASPEEIGCCAAKRTISRLNARRLQTQKCPILFEAPVAAGLLGHFVQAASGGALYRKSSFLVDSLGEQIFARHINVEEDPYIMGGMGSAPFDDEGVKTKKRKVVQKGVIEGYFLSSYSARKLGMQTTGNSGGAHNLILVSRQTKKEDDFASLLKKMGKGLLVTELMGQGVNYVTGDYSRGASGYWVENGVIQYPVQEITIAGNLKEMFKQIVAVGADTIIRGSRKTGSVLIENMMVAGS